MNIKIVGSNCSNGIKLKKSVFKVGKELKGKFILELLDTESDKKKYNISNIPALVINDKVISQGKVLTDREIKHYVEILS